MPNQGSLGGQGQQTPSQGKRENVRDDKGGYVRLLTETPKKCERCDQTRNKAPAPVKPYPGERRNEQGFSGSPVDGITSRQEYKEYKKIFQGNVFIGSIEKLNVTLLE